MSKSYKPYLLATCLLSLSICFASDSDSELPQIITSTEVGESAIDETAERPTLTSPVISESVEKATFSSFTGRVRGKKVRMRINPELDGYIIKELNNGDLLAVINEKDDFWAVEPVADTKAYVFRSFVLDSTVEGNHVNLRLEPSLEAPIIGHLNTGDKVDGTISPINGKWLEITPPKNISFFVSKEFIENVGGPEIKVEFETRRCKVEELLDITSLLVKAELRKNFSEIDVERLVHSYNLVINDFKDFPEYVEQAQNELTSLNEAYLHKKIEYLENQANGVDESVASEEEMEIAAVSDTVTDKMKLWEPIEESLYLTWARLNEDRNMHEYYDEQKLNSVILTGIVESYNAAVKNKPGSYIIRDENNLPIGYVYSSNVNLDNFIGRKASLVTSPRPNNNFAFPAYYVHEVE